MKVEVINIIEENQDTVCFTMYLTNDKDEYIQLANVLNELENSGVEQTDNYDCSEEYQYCVKVTMIDVINKYI